MIGTGEVLVKFTADTKEVDKSTKSVTSSFGGMSAAMTVANLAAKAVSKGIQLITQNLDGAISRIDTMNNFPKVMKNFGVSSDEASESVKRIEQSVLGLPTSLDQAVSSVQDLFMVTQNLEESEKLFQAVNDSAMIFANGSTEAVSHFIYGYKQALSAGKVSAQDFNQMNQAIPGLMTKVAERMGITYAQLKEGLSNGTITIEQFNNALKLLDTEGIGTMEAMRDTALTATGGIATAITNAKTAVTRGVASIVTTFDKALKSNGLGSLANVISTIGKAFEKLLKGETLDLTKVTEFTQGFINTIVDLAQKVIKTLPKIIEALGNLLPTLITQLFKGITTIANTIANMYPKLIPIIVQAIMQTIPALLENLPLFIEAGMEMQLALIDGIMEALPQLIDSMPIIIEKFLSALIPQLPRITMQAPQIIFALVKGLIKAIPTLVASIPKIVTAIINGLSKGVSGAFNVGKNIVKGLWNGMSGLKDWVINKVKNMGSSIIKSLKNTLGIHSPSTEFALIGKFSVLGYTEQLEKMQKDVESQVASTFGLNPQLTGSMQNSFSPNVQVYNNVNVEQDPLGQMVSNIKTFSGGAKNDYNYGSGI